MTDANKATLANIAALLASDRISVAKALEGAFVLGELAGKLQMASVAESRVHEVLTPVLEIMSGKARP